MPATVPTTGYVLLDCFLFLGGIYGLVFLYIVLIEGPLLRAICRSWGHVPAFADVEICARCGRAIQLKGGKTYGV